MVVRHHCRKVALKNSDLAHLSRAFDLVDNSHLTNCFEIDDLASIVADVVVAVVGGGVGANVGGVAGGVLVVDPCVGERAYHTRAAGHGFHSSPCSGFGKKNRN